jgi:hypothetical protein
MRKLALSLFALVLPVGLSQAQVQLPAGSTHFQIYQGDKVIGSADATIQPNSAGYSISSQGNMKLSKFSYSFNNSQHTDGNLNLVSDQLSGTVNGSQVAFTAHADSTGRQFQISINAQGKQTSNTVDRHQHMALLADLDPAAYIILTQIGHQNPPTSWILLPKEQGIVVPSNYTTNPSVRGRLNGTQIDVQHTTVTISEQNGITVELYTAHNGQQLLEADLPEQNFFVVHAGFQLIDRPQSKPPRSPNPPPQQQNGQPQQQQQAPPPQVQQQ